MQISINLPIWSVRAFLLFFSLDIFPCPYRYSLLNISLPAFGFSHERSAYVALFQSCQQSSMQHPKNGDGGRERERDPENCQDISKNANISHALGPSFWPNHEMSLSQGARLEHQTLEDFLALRDCATCEPCPSPTGKAGGRPEVLLLGGDGDESFESIWFYEPWLIEKLQGDQGWNCRRMLL